MLVFRKFLLQPRVLNRAGVDIDGAVQQDEEHFVIGNRVICPRSDGGEVSQKERCVAFVVSFGGMDGAILDQRLRDAEKIVVFFLRKPVSAEITGVEGDVGFMGSDGVDDLPVDIVVGSGISIDGDFGVEQACQKQEEDQNKAKGTDVSAAE